MASSWGRSCINTTRICKGTIEPIIQAAVDPVRNAVEARGCFTTLGLNPGNQRRRWHGTNRKCNIGDDGRTSFCSSSRCSLCRIIKTSFDVSLAKQKTGWGRFGSGIYTSSVSSKSATRSSVVAIWALIRGVSRANDYSENLVDSPWKAILLNLVVVGEAKVYKTDRPTLTEPPEGYDSVRSMSPPHFRLSCDFSIDHREA